MTKPLKLSPAEQRNLDISLAVSAEKGHMDMVGTLLALGADVHAQDDATLCWAASHGYPQTVRLLLDAGANVHAQNDHALRRGAYWGYAEMVQLLANQIFAAESWRGKSRAEIEAEANALYNKIKADNPQPDRLRTAGTILLDCALCCWEQVRPAPPKIQISPRPAQPRPL
jgi:ankyrin repeat protein